MSDAITKRLRFINFAAAAGLVLAVSSTVLFGVMPITNQVRVNNQAADKIRHELDQLDGLSNTLAQVESQLNSTQSRLAQAETRLPSSGAMDEFMAQLARIADQTSLQVNAILPRPPQDADTYRTLPIEISGTGSFESCYKFLTGIRRMDRLTRLDDLVIQLESNTPDKDASDSKPLCRINVVISTFMAK